MKVLNDDETHYNIEDYNSQWRINESTCIHPKHNSNLHTEATAEDGKNGVKC